MTEYAPSAIAGVYDLVTVGSKEFSGILGDSAHTYGYHRCRDVLPGSDYSVVLPLDLRGDGQAASALDIKLNAADMKLVTGRLLAAAKAHDPRLKAVREFCGTSDGTSTHSYDIATGHEGFNEWDNSHLWHIHLSIYRAYCNDAAALAGIASVINGGEEKLKLDAEDQKFIADTVSKVIYGDASDATLAKLKKPETHPVNIESLYNMMKVLVGFTPEKIAAALKAAGVSGGAGGVQLTDAQLDAALHRVLGSLG